jgi:adenylate kinase family enzyme
VQAHALRAMCPSSLVFVVVLVVPLMAVRRRVKTRGRPDDIEATLAGRLVSYERDTRPMLSWYLRRGSLVHVDANQSPDAVTLRIERHLAELGVGTSLPRALEDDHEAPPSRTPLHDPRP